ncbi:unnamed protein product [Microthlaspi erraticum]|uniref:Uncharacterized protein n=1 Tax=Microthlaspi erraticum TaxID=1685480 RepID=A0A6D2HW92_9BRAS|nr:unnamed protein product [Microthlaspi erraticum]
MSGQPQERKGQSTHPPNSPMISARRTASQATLNKRRRKKRAELFSDLRSLSNTPDDVESNQPSRSRNGCTLRRTSSEPHRFFF